MNTAIFDEEWDVYRFQEKKRIYSQRICLATTLIKGSKETSLEVGQIEIVSHPTGYNGKKVASLV